jgi:hypothetical protein
MKKLLLLSLFMLIFISKIFSQATDRTESGTSIDDGANNPSNEGEVQAFDNNNNSKWLIFNSTGNIGYDFANDDAYVINSYSITSGNDEPNRDPRNWNLQGSNDGVNWTTVDSQNNQGFGNRFETKTYNFGNTTAYKLYRLNVTANNGSGLLQIAEIQMFGVAGTGGGGGPSSSRLQGIQGVTSIRPILIGDPNGDPNWNWKVQNFGTIYFRGTGNGTFSVNAVTNPFYDPTNAYGKLDPNLIDFDEKDGWVFVCRDFGTPTIAPVYPFFILYNRFTGIMRVCIYRTVNLGASYQAVSLSLAEGSTNTKVSSFAFADSNFDNSYQNQFNSNLTQTVLVRKVGDFGWMIADFNMTNYDINLESEKNSTAVRIRIQINDIQETNANLEGEIFLENIQPKSSDSQVIPVDDWAKKGGAGADFIGGDSKSLPKLLTTVGKLSSTDPLINSLKSLGSVLGVLSGLGSLVSMFIGGDNASSFDIKLKGTTSLKGTLTLSAPKDNIPILLGQSSANTQVYRSLNNISWGVVSLSKNTDLPVISRNGPSIEEIMNGYGSGNSLFTQYFTTGFNLNNIVKNPNIPDLILEDVKVKYIHNNNNLGTTYTFGNDFYSLNDFKNGLFNIRYFQRVTGMGGAGWNDVPENIGVQFTLRPTGITHLLGNKPVVIYKEFKFNRSSTYPNSRIAVLGNYKEERSLNAYPNPFSDIIKIPIQVLEGNSFQVVIYSVDGKEVWKTSNTQITSEGNVEWDGKSQTGLQMSAGTYVVKVISNGNENVHKILLQK